MIHLRMYLLAIRKIFLRVKQWLFPLMGFGAKLAPPKPVSYVDPKRYSGKWYQIAAIPSSYTEGYVGISVTFGKLSSNETSFTINYYEDDFKGPQKERKGTAWVIDEGTNAKVKVQVVWPFTSEYWTLYLDSDYKYSATGDPDRSALQIMSRTPTMDDKVYSEIVKRMAAQNYDISKLKKTPQKATGSSEISK